MKNTILIIDDEESIITALSLILEDEGYNVKTMQTGNGAMEYAKIIKPNIILLDVLLSGTDGRHVCKTFKLDLILQSIPIIMFSAHPSAKNMSVKCGADAFLAKPFETEDLLKLLKSLLVKQ